MHVTVGLNDYLWRPLTDSDEDTDFVLSLRNSPAAQAALYTGRATVEEHRRFLEDSRQRDDEINWIIEWRGTRVGTSGLFHIDRRNRRAEGGRVLVATPDLYDRNLLVMSYVVFEHLGLDKLVGDALTTSVHIIRALERLGAVREAVLREHVIKDGLPRDVGVYGLLRRDWQRIRPGIAGLLGEPHLVRHAVEEMW